MPPAGDVTREWPEAARSRARGADVPRRRRRVSFRVYLHDAVPEMLGNLLTGTAALVISAVILLPIYRRLEAADVYRDPRASERR